MRTKALTTGFSLIELLIAMTIGLVILTVLGGVFSRTSSGRSDLDRVSRLVENSRFAADLLGEDVRHAGFYGTFMPPGAGDVAYVDSSPCTWDASNPAGLGWNPKVTPPSYPTPIQGWDDPGAGVAALDCLVNRVPGTDVLVIRRVSSAPSAIAEVTDANLYVQPSRCAEDGPAEAPTLPEGQLLLRVSNKAADFTLHRARPLPCRTAADVSELRRYMVRAYYVASCNVCDGTDNEVPTLKRVENGGAPVSLAEGVENLQFEYAFDTDGNGVPDQYLTTTGAAGPTSIWANVVGVRVRALMRSSEPGLTADATPTLYDLGPNHANVPCPDRFRCRLMTSTFRLNNVAGRLER